MSLDKEIDDIITRSITKHEKLAEILKLVIDKCGIDQSKYFILGSYALREHRTISDLDISMFYKEFEKLYKLGVGEFQLYNKQIRWFYDLTEKYKEVDPSATDFSIEVFRKCQDEGFPNENFSLGKLIEKKGLDVDKYGHQFFSLDTLLDWKTTMGRDKDTPDIELIKQIQSSASSKSHGGSQEMSYNELYHKYIKYKRRYTSLKREYLMTD